MKTTQITDALKIAETTKTYTSFQKAASTSDPVYLFQLPAKCAIISFYVQLEHAFNLPSSDCKLSSTGDFVKNIDISNRRPGDDFERNFTLSPYMYSVTNALNIYATIYSVGLGFWENYPYSLNLAKYGNAAAGHSASALSFGGYNSNSGSLTLTEMSVTGPWSVIGDLQTTRYYHAGCGSGASAALAIGGVVPGSSYTNSVEKFQIGPPQQEYPGYTTGTWTVTGALNVGAFASAAIGSTNDALNTGGSGAAKYSYTQRYLGNVWTNESNMLCGYYFHGIAGVVNDCLVFGGYDSPVTYKTTELYNGTVWSVGPSLNQPRTQLSGLGKKTTGGIIAFGGIYNFEVAPTEEYQSSSGVWTVTNNMNTARRYSSGCGNIGSGQGGGLAIGGYSSILGHLDSTELYSASGSNPAVLSGLTAGEVTFKMKYIQYE